MTAYKKGCRAPALGLQAAGAQRGCGELRPSPCLPCLAPRISRRSHHPGPGAECRSPGGGAEAAPRSTERGGSWSSNPGRKVGHLGAPRHPVSLGETCRPLTRPQRLAAESGAVRAAAEVTGTEGRGCLRASGSPRLGRQRTAHSEPVGGCARLSPGRRLPTEWAGKRRDPSGPACQRGPRS